MKKVFVLEGHTDTSYSLALDPVGPCVSPSLFLHACRVSECVYASMRVRVSAPAWECVHVCAGKHDVMSGFVLEAYPTWSTAAAKHVLHWCCHCHWGL